MEELLKSIALIIIGIMIAGVISCIIEVHRYIIPMNALGIEKFQKCEINTTNCHSNWYEIVWRKDCR